MMKAKVSMRPMCIPGDSTLVSATVEPFLPTPPFMMTWK
uniref:Uncharacterized protein n=1 Tax=Anguilla anguilla TaxID=7936 RepID=A0A0E9TDX8_ANGAN